MATQVISEEEFRDTCAEVADAIALHDWGTAAVKIAVASAIITAFQIKKGGAGALSEWRESLKGLREDMTFAMKLYEATADDKRLITVQTQHTKTEGDTGLQIIR